MFISGDGINLPVPPNDYDHNHDRDSIECRLDAVERALTEEAAGTDELPDRIDRIDELETRIAELEAAVLALRGYVGSVRAINEDVERRADRALRKANAVERNVAPSPAHGGEESERNDSLAWLRERL